MQYSIAQLRKCLIAASGAAVAGVGAAALDGSVTVPELVASAGAALVFGFAVFRVPNE